MNQEEVDRMKRNYLTALLLLVAIGLVCGFLSYRAGYQAAVLRVEKAITNAASTTDEAVKTAEELQTLVKFWKEKAEKAEAKQEQKKVEKAAHDASAMITEHMVGQIQKSIIAREPENSLAKALELLIPVRDAIKGKDSITNKHKELED